jgi:hypothetical protein
MAGVAKNQLVRIKRNPTALVLLLLLAACSPRDFLTRRLAGDLISASAQMKTPQTFTLRTGIVSSKEYPAPEYLVLQNHGWLSANAIACSPGLIPPPCWNIVLTPSGVETVGALIPGEHSSKSAMSVPVAKRELVGVTGIATQDNSADVEFEWKWVPLNEIGEALYSRDVRYKSSVGFRKYDDGWRVIQGVSHPGQSMEDAVEKAEPVP